MIEILRMNYNKDHREWILMNEKEKWRDVRLKRDSVEFRNAHP